MYHAFWNRGRGKEGKRVEDGREWRAVSWAFQFKGLQLRKSKGCSRGCGTGKKYGPMHTTQVGFVRVGKGVSWDTDTVDEGSAHLRTMVPSGTA